MCVFFFSATLCRTSGAVQEFQDGYRECIKEAEKFVSAHISDASDEGLGRRLTMSLDERLHRYIPTAPPAPKRPTSIGFSPLAPGSSSGTNPSTPGTPGTLSARTPQSLLLSPTKPMLSSPCFTPTSPVGTPHHPLNPRSYDHPTPSQVFFPAAGPLPPPPPRGHDLAFPRPHLNQTASTHPMSPFLDRLEHYNHPSPSYPPRLVPRSQPELTSMQPTTPRHPLSSPSLPQLSNTNSFGSEHPGQSFLSTTQEPISPLTAPTTICRESAYAPTLLPLYTRSMTSIDRPSQPVSSSRSIEVHSTHSPRRPLSHSISQLSPASSTLPLDLVRSNPSFIGLLPAIPLSQEVSSSPGESVVRTHLQTQSVSNQFIFPQNSNTAVHPDHANQRHSTHSLHHYSGLHWWI